MNICIYGAASDDISEKYISAAHNLGCLLARNGHALVFGGGNHGLMGAAARGVYENSGKIIGISPEYFHYDGEIFEHCTELVFTADLSERKKLLESRSDALVVLPGGYGTLDEFFGAVAQKAAGEHNKPIAVLNAGNYYSGLNEFIAFSKSEGFIRKKFENLCRICSDAEAVLKYIEGKE